MTERGKNTCATCRHWVSWTTPELRGECKEGISVQRSAEIPGPFTDKDFGCILHKPKPDWCEECAEEFLSKQDASTFETRSLATSVLANHIRKHWKASLVAAQAWKGAGGE